MAINSDFRARLCEAAVLPLHIMKPGTAPNGGVTASGPTDKLIGTSDELSHVTGEIADLAVGPVPKVVLGGPVAAGDALTSDANGAAVATTTTGHRYIGFAEIPGVAGDVITYFRSPGVL